MTAVEPDIPPYPKTPPGQLFPHPILDEWRRENGMTKVHLPYGGDAWVITRYEDVRKVLQDHRFSRNKALDRARSYEKVPRGDSIIGMDPPEHNRMRKILAKAFSVRRVELMKPHVAEITTSFLDRMEAVGKPADIMEHLCLPLPVMVICQLLGVPFEDRPKFRAWCDTFGKLDKSAAEQGKAYEALRGYLMGLLREREANPTGDLLSSMIHARDLDKDVSDDELGSLATIVFFAGHQAVGTLLGSSLWLFMERPDEFRRLRDNPDQLGLAVDEVIRCVPFLSSAGPVRVALEDVKLSGGIVRADEAVIVHEPASNRDEDVFERPAEVDFTRSPNPHLGFGFGPHYCIGAQMARMEFQVVLEAVLQRFPNLAVAEGADVLWLEPPWGLNGLRSLPVTW